MMKLVVRICVLTLLTLLFMAAALDGALVPPSQITFDGSEANYTVQLMVYGNCFLLKSAPSHASKHGIR